MTTTMTRTTKTKQLIGLFAALAFLANAACTTTKTYEGHDKSALATSLRPGDIVDVVETDGSSYELTIDRVTADALIGERPYLGRVEVPMHRIETVEVTKIAPGKTAAAVVAVPVVVALGAVLLLVSAGDGIPAAAF